MSVFSAIIGKYRGLNFFQFPIVTACISLTLQFIQAIVLITFISGGGLSRSTKPDSYSVGGTFQPVKFFLLAVLFAPIVETYIFQQGVINLLTKFINSRLLGVLVSALIFGTLHLRGSPMSGAQALLSGLVFATAFVVWLDKTKNQKQAYAVTCLSHMLHNFAYLVMSYIPASVIFGAF